MIVWRQVFGWLRRKHLGTGWKELRRRYCGGGWWPHDGDVVLFNPARSSLRNTGLGGRPFRRPGPARSEESTCSRACGEPDAGPTRTSGSGGRRGETGWE
ncbi:hypothetical protein ACSHXN_44815 (plasmid) [Streptomyces sp. HUAS TT11]|uniref:hypothetical protein n=1 Tax=Streptomyces sp. HUAS TT11 TaxID=3447508 RepID=UPI003F65739E